MRYLVVILGLLALVGGLVAIKFKQISSLMNMGKQMAKAGPPPEAVGTATRPGAGLGGHALGGRQRRGGQGRRRSATTRPASSRASTSSRAQMVKQGQVLVELDTSVERAQLASAQARHRPRARSTSTRSRALVASNAIAQAQLDNDEAQLKTSTTDVDALSAQIDRKIVRAPFCGRLGIRAVNLGQYLNPGTPITVLEAIDAVYVDFSLPQQHLGERHGRHAGARHARAARAGAPLDGHDRRHRSRRSTPTTRTIKLRATVPNKRRRRCAPACS